MLASSNLKKLDKPKKNASAIVFQIIPLNCRTKGDRFFGKYFLIYGSGTFMDLSKFLKEKRLQAGLSQGAVAKKLGYTSPQFVSNWERGLSQPPVATLRKIAQIYNISANDMFDVMLKATIDQVTAELTEKFYKQSKSR